MKNDVQARMSHERRSGTRYNIYLPVTMRPEGHGDESWIKTFTINVSRSGAYILSRSKWKLNQKIDMFIDNSTENGESWKTPLHLSARIVRIDMLSAPVWHAESGYALGVQFDGPMDIENVMAQFYLSGILSGIRAMPLSAL